jgi:hypothetical protein
MSAVTVTVATAPVDAKCKSIMRKLLTAGFARANTDYVTASSSDLDVDDFHYLLRHGVLDMNNGNMLVLHSCMVGGSRGIGSGQIAFSLNVDLA